MTKFKKFCVGLFKGIAQVLMWVVVYISVLIVGLCGPTAAIALAIRLVFDWL